MARIFSVKCQEGSIFNVTLKLGNADNSSRLLLMELRDFFMGSRDLKPLWLPGYASPYGLFQAASTHIITFNIS